MKIVVGYAVVASAYILASDRLVEHFVTDPQGIVRVSMVKGWLFVGITAAFLAFLVRRLVLSISARESDLYDLVKTIPDLLWIKDTQGRYVSGNPAFFEAIGHPEKEVVGHRLAEFSDDDQCKRIAELDQTIIETRLPVHWIEEKVQQDKKTFKAVSKLPIFNSDGDITGIMGLCRDVTEFKQLEESLRQSEQQFRAVVESSPHGVLMVDESGLITLVNKEIERAFGYSRRELVGRPVEILLHEDFRSEHAKMRQELAVNPQPRAASKSGIIIGLRNDGSEIPIQVGFNPVRTGGASFILATVQDMSEQVSVQQKIRDLALFDNLTALPNRSLFQQHLAAVIAEAGPNKGRVSLLSVNLDRFKSVNDLLGHGAGDQVLRETAARLRERLREKDFVARTGADEFTIIAPDTNDLAALANKVMATISQPIDISGHECQVTASIGISTFPMDAQESAELLRCAELAQGQAKQSAPSALEFYSEVLTHRSARRFAIETALRGALETGEFSLNFQPIVNLATGQIASAEALLRWTNPDLGFVSPAEFVPIAEETDLIIGIGAWVLREACQTASRWIKSGAMEYVSVNLSPRQFADEELCEKILGALSDAGLEPKHLELEVTESMFINEPEASVMLLRHLQAVGVRIAVDDFGTGYSSLSYLKLLPIDKIKIDRSFIMDTPADRESSTIVKTVIGLAQGLNKATVAEGVETVEQAAFLHDLGCEYVQGYYFSKPLSAADFESLNTKSWSPTQWTALPQAA